jgi:hypothetical protein
MPVAKRFPYKAKARFAAVLMWEDSMHVCVLQLQICRGAAAWRTCRCPFQFLTSCDRVSGDTCGAYSVDELRVELCQAALYGV